MEREEFQREAAYFDRVEEIIRRKLEKLCGGRASLRDQVLRERKDMWEENRHVIREFDDVVLLSAQEANVNFAQDQYERNELEIQRLTKLEKSPYFGRVDFEDSEVGENDTIYIGVYSLAEEESHEIYVVDWRAPIASMFYQFDLGPARYEAGGRRIEVEMTRKRQYKIEEGRLLAAYDTDSSMYDDILGEVLSGHSEHRLKVIIGSIQREQNLAIRSDTRRSCLIYGLAGSGKTSIGLHRLAYLLYCNKDTVRSENILIVSNNNIFGSYISTILPDLGERPAETKVFAELLEEALGEGLKVEDYYTQLKRVEDRPDPERIKWLRVKYSPELLRYFIDYFASFSFQIPEIRYKAPEVQCPASEIRNQTPEARHPAPEIQSQAPEIGSQAPEAWHPASEIQSQAPEARHQAPEIGSRAPEVQYPAAEIESSASEIPCPEDIMVSPELLRSKMDLGKPASFRTGFERVNYLVKKTIEEYFFFHKEEIYDGLVESHEDDIFSTKEANALYKRTMYEAVRSAQEEIVRLNRVDAGKQMLEAFSGYLRLTGERDGEADREMERLAVSLERGKLWYEDALLYLFVKVLMGDVKPNEKIRHIVIDEVQDYNLVQLYIMKYLFPRSSFTLLGDIYQTVNSLTTIRDYDDFSKVFGDSLMRIRLSKCYRSSSDINALAFALINETERPIAEEYSYFQRAVRKPRYTICQDMFSCLVPLLEQLEKYRSVAVIVNSDEEALAVKSYLQEKKQAQMIISPEDELEDGIVIIPLLLAKGLEFDAVILFNCIHANRHSAHLRRRVYLGCTRALHELYFVEKEGLPESLQECEGYMEIEDWAGQNRRDSLA